MSYSDGEKICQTNNATLVSIHYAEEQNFLAHYIFTKKKTVDNVWIGAKYDKDGKTFYWVDRTTLSTKSSFSNWALGNPKNLTDYCVQMHSDVGSVGKWVDEPCARKNLVACQRPVPLPETLISETVVELKHLLQLVSGELTETSNRLTKTEVLLENTEKRLTQVENRLSKTEAVLAKIETNHDQNSNSKLVKVEEELKKTEGALTKTENSLSSLSIRLAKAEAILALNQQQKSSIDSVIPIGFIYVQLPKDKAPAELWPTLTWQEVSDDYEGVFFRVSGGDAAAFGEVQEAHAPRLSSVGMSHMSYQQQHIHHGRAVDWSSYSKATIHPSGEWSEPVMTGCLVQTTDALFMRFKTTGTSGNSMTEVRPRNMAVKVYRRTA